MEPAVCQGLVRLRAGVVHIPTARRISGMHAFSVITVGLSPKIHLGPLTLSWHGLTIAIGILAGAKLASVFVTRLGLPTAPISTVAGLAALGGLVGGRIFYVLEHGGPLLGTTGFTFDGGLILAAVLIVAYVRHERLDGRYLDAMAVSLPLGVALGRIGDVINGEHYGARSDFLLAVRNSSPDALTPNSAYAYQNGGLYEVLLATLIFTVAFGLRNRLPRVGDAVWLVLALFAVGRFFEFFLRSDSPALALGLNNTQWTSVVLLIVVILGRSLAGRPGIQRLWLSR